MESTNILQDMDDESICLEEEVCEAEIEMDMVQPKLGEELNLPTSPSTYDSSTQTQKSFVIYENPCYNECETKNCMVLYGNRSMLL
jgi:hypothetical protein